ncbi:type VI secretion system protein ImpG [Paraburkholderia sp. GAS199]|uniref:type VI secretion system baseplate subunit TssF n=1 Tax=Paraburkholderia sp. GAS199 TaxID=3035126 RepID=UPI003D1C8BB9
MDSRLLDYYHRELAHMHELEDEFAQAHPRFADRLGPKPDEEADPYVERLVDSFAFMSARTNLKLDTEFPRFAGRILDVLYPGYMAPIPSMTVARLYPRTQQGSLTEGFHVPRGTRFVSRPTLGDKTACEFRSSQDVTLYPLEIVHAQLTGVPVDIPMLDRYVPPDRQVRGALRLRLRATGEAGIASLRGLTCLPLYLTGDDQVASHLFELLHTATIATITGAPGACHDCERSFSVVTQDAITHEGLDENQALLPIAWSNLHGHNLIREYFACPSRFYFFNLTGLSEGLSRVKGQEVEVIVLLDRHPEWLAEIIDAAQFALFCTPVINLFPSRIERIELNEARTEFHLVPKRHAPSDYEVYSVDSLTGMIDGDSTAYQFRPLFHTLNKDTANHGRYFSLRREPRVLSSTTLRHGTRSSYVGTEAFVSLVDQHDAPYRDGLRYLSVEAWLTNRDLPTLLERNGVSDLDADHSLPIESIGLIRRPTTPRTSFSQTETARRLIGHLNFNSLPLDCLDGRSGAKTMRDMLRLYLTDVDAGLLCQVEGLVDVTTRPVTRKMADRGPLVTGRGIECRLTVDETRFSGVSPYLFGLVLDRYLAQRVCINSFIETELRSMQRGHLKRWSVRTPSGKAAS